jgi:hypothetical protein
MVDGDSCLLKVHAYESAAGVLAGIPQHKLWVKADSAREMYQCAMGSHPDQREWPLTAH